MDTPMLQKLREYLANTPREQIDRDWAEVKALGLEGPTAKELIASFRLPLPFQITDTEAFQNEATQHCMTTFESEGNHNSYVMAA